MPKNDDSDKALKKARKLSDRLVATGTLVDRDENISQLEPMLITSEKHREVLDDLILDLISESASLKSSLPEAFVEPISTLVRALNCYYSNLIEGHYTHPIDIERAIKKDYSKNPEKRNLQLEAEAHISVQTWIDSGSMDGRPTDLQNIKQIHKRFYELLPAELCQIEDPATKDVVSVVPGQLRAKDVAVGNHLAISPGAIDRFMLRYETVYGNQSRNGKILSAAAAHHRLLWIHPFLDGNGRVARLVSYATLLEVLNTGGIWSIARGLARQHQQYKDHLAQCDQVRRGNLDGRGHLSEEALFEFTKFFLRTCIDQVKFMRALVRPEQLRKRVSVWAAEEIAAKRLPPRTNMILDSLVACGEILRADVPSILQLSPAAARRVIAALSQRGVITSESTRAPIRLAFPAALAPDWLPGLFVEN